MSEPPNNYGQPPTPPPVSAPPFHPNYQAAQGPNPSEASGKKLAAGLCGILIGSLGVHKFILGYTTAGVTMLLVTVLTCGVGAIVMSVIGIVEGILYLTKSDEDFYYTYMVRQKEWF